ncbi:hypothetical protein Cfor_01722 [Coptotermes formosanus]|uniref:Uncharacterized protein n=1 Tax=Coptotermes formosanus TaxID=36987 RepID=A0A6L2PV33_COPFO|nr:hypothetical protein Cfor_01722 [Coptotermes formosanus]
MIATAVLKEGAVKVLQDFEETSRDEIWYRFLEGEDARKLDQMFNRHKCLIEVNPGRMLMPQKYEEMGHYIRAMEVRPSDVWVISYPRTGDENSFSCWQK